MAVFAGHFALVEPLLPKLRAQDHPSRVVLVSSMGHLFQVQSFAATDLPVLLCQSLAGQHIYRASVWLAVSWQVIMVTLFWAVSDST